MKKEMMPEPMESAEELPNDPVVLHQLLDSLKTEIDELRKMPGAEAKKAAEDAMMRRNEIAKWLSDLEGK